MNVANKAIEEMLKNADPQSRKVMANILTGKIVANIYCLSEDVKSTREVSVLDKSGNPVLYKSGDKKGEVKTTTEEYISRVGCKGRHIGVVYDNGRAEPVRADDGNFYLRATRQRLDGVIGCECWCGQDSRISKQEAGDLKFDGQPPTKQGLESIFKRIQKDPTLVEIKNGRTEIDGFAFEELR
jgi:hypothetical protein